MTKRQNVQQVPMEARRRFIIHVAHECLRNKGLWGTSMADIIQRSNFGAGQIYRCFSNKDEIVEEVIQNIIQARVNHMLTPSNDVGKIVFMQFRPEITCPVQDKKDDALILEIHAEAMRNQRIAKIVHLSQRKYIYQLKQLIKSHYPWFDGDQLMARTVLIAMLTDSLPGRNSFRIKKDESSKTLQQLVQTALNDIFKAPPDWPDRMMP